MAVNAIQATGITGRAGATGLAFGSNVTAGSLLVAAFQMPSGTSPAPTGGGTWATVLGAITGGQNGQSYSTWVCLSATGGATTVKWTGTATEINIAEFAAITSQAKDGANQSGAGGPSNINSGNITTTGAGGWVFANVSVVLASPVGVAAGWSKESEVSNNEVAGLWSRAAGQAAGTYAFTTTLSNANWDAQVCAVSSPSAAAVIPSGQRLLLKAGQ